VIISLSIVLLIIVLIFAWKFQLTNTTIIESNQPASQTMVESDLSNQNSGPDAVINYIDESQLPERFPSDIPIEAGAETTLNYNTINSAGQFQASREFISKLSAEQNFNFYQQSLINTGWHLKQTLDDIAHGQKLIFAEKDGNELNIRIYSDADKVKVSINNITKP
jgi:hypothetical protein